MQSQLLSFVTFFVMIGYGKSEAGSDYATFVTTLVYDPKLIKGEAKGDNKYNVCKITRCWKEIYS